MNEETQLGEIRVAFFRRDRRSVRPAREFTRAVMEEWRFRGREDDVLLCVSELATNAVLHGVPPGRGFSVRLSLLRADGRLRLEVHDSGPEDMCLRETSPESEAGRGLLLVSALADKWGVGQRNPGKFVWCEFEAAVPGRPR
ncbi:ATP-binding protein [Streptomyces camelliae]|uniref:ATP-binding protein n=1 Tax=Streptomyces camelliae TaxID=3004093 RepID=A0ABY7P013_9ACTN|nr:ATP-binding protein [Streptomyces sp. HUAS 2-6]WBO63660.1 ATP-binding protein [Streptomyces sp. HUAS 2-6]